MYYQQIRGWQGQTMPRGTNSRRLGVLDSPTSPIRMDHEERKGTKSDPERSLSTHEFYRDTYYILKHKDSLT